MKQRKRGEKERKTGKDREEKEEVEMERGRDGNEEVKEKTNRS